MWIYTNTRRFFEYYSLFLTRGAWYCYASPIGRELYCIRYLAPLGVAGTEAVGDRMPAKFMPAIGEQMKIWLKEISGGLFGLLNH